MLLSDPDSTTLEHSEEETPAAAACSNNPDSLHGSAASGLKKLKR